MPVELVFVLVVVLFGIAGAALGLAVYAISAHQD